ncbi:hypothetical protein E4K62_01230 [Microbacterium wangchenii]|uniref:Uncharacterized protein n=1 Tax=Microbacterium wangchenii TaxID=2541726 RepID=A0ABX5SMT4_9MICO|nr:hypothetical protein E4K62_01230 [Microbacterium wangchenii]TXK14760.1 hypothetical protein FVP99_13810 [Microbacterium wangchenii]
MPLIVAYGAHPAMPAPRAAPPEPHVRATSVHPRHLLTARMHRTGANVGSRGEAASVRAGRRAAVRAGRRWGRGCRRTCRPRAPPRRRRRRAHRAPPRR